RQLEVIVIDDRSTDATGAIIDRIATAHPALRVLHIDALPDGWLGKNHALHCGALVANGEFLIFTDADVVFAPEAIRRAMAYCQAQAVDHLALLFDVVARTQLLRMMLLGFGIAFMQRFRPWKVADSPDHFIGVGGFNMVRATAYDAVGGHAAIRLAVIDDLMLGRLLKRGGFRQHVLAATGLVGIEWYAGTLEMIRGLEKNLFAAFDFRLSRLVALTPLILAVRIWPWVALLATRGATWWLSLATVLVTLALHVDLLRARGWSARCLVFAPVVPVIELIMCWRACLLTTLRGDIRWRGTVYPLARIRQAHAQMEAASKPRQVGAGADA
ncbi:MAG: glycosyltransferase, partial [Herminiimonas sp.]|nr:glycosyltransferase [Herminiimonas sp.]